MQSSAPAPAPAPAAQQRQSKWLVLFDEIPDPTVQRRVAGLNASRYMIIYQGCDPQSASSGVINTEAVLKEIATKIAATIDGKAPMWGMLDFEDPFNAILQEGVDSPKYQAIVQTMVATIRAVKQQYPNMLWTYYGTPFIPYWIDGKNWLNSTTEARKTLLDKIYKSYAPIIAEVDWVSTSIYPVYDPMMFEPKTPDDVRAHGRAWRSTCVGLAKILAAGKPVIPTISPIWQPNGVAKAGTLVPETQFIEDQVAPAIAAGAAGVAIWSGIGYGIELAVDGEAKHLGQDSNFGTRVWREAFVAEYLDQSPPKDWADPLVRSTLVRKASNSIFDALRWIRVAELKDEKQ